jgi:hypothetical protein
MIKDYKGYKITIEKQKPSVTKPETEEEWDKHFETHGGETKGTHKYKVEDKEGIIINEDDTEMWDTQACLDNAMADIEAEIKTKRIIMIKKTWSLDSIKIYLTNDKGDEIILNSGDLNDYTMNEVIDDVEKYVKQKGGELE